MAKTATTWLAEDVMIRFSGKRSSAYRSRHPTKRIIMKKHFHINSFMDHELLLRQYMKGEESLYATRSPPSDHLRSKDFKPRGLGVDDTPPVNFDLLPKESEFHHEEIVMSNNLIRDFLDG
jgi:hypothetical protein